MKKVYFSLLILLYALPFLQAQEDYKGFYLAGQAGYYNINSDVYSINSSLGLGYFFNRSHRMFFSPMISVSKSNFIVSGQIEQRYSEDFGGSIGYEYIHWFSNRIGLGAAVSGSYTQERKWNAPLVLNLYVRATDRIDLSLSIGRAFIYNQSSSSGLTSIVQNEGNGFTEFQSKSFSIPSAIFSNIGMAYRFNPDSFLSPKDGTFELPNRTFGLDFSMSNTSFKSRAFNDEGILIGTSDINEFEIGIGGFLRPLDRLTYGARLSYRGSSFDDSSNTRSIYFTPVIKFNKFYADGFGLFASGGFSVGIINLGHSIFDASYAYSPSIGSGVQYLIKKRVLLQLNLINLQYNSSQFGPGFRFNSFSGNLMSNPQISTVVLL